MAGTMISGVKMRRLRHAAEVRELARRDELLEVLPEGFPALREGFPRRAAEEVVGELARAERREEGEALLFLPRSAPRLLLDLKHQSDGGDVVRRARLPVGAKAASAGETEVARSNKDRRGGAASLSAIASSTGSPKARPEIVPSRR